LYASFEGIDFGKPTLDTEDLQNGMEDFDFTSLFSYSVRVFYQSVSNSVAKLYETEYNLTASEWRTMIILGPHNCMAAKEIVVASSMDKVTVSRAVVSMQKKALLKRDIDGDDKRKSALRLTNAGREVYFSLLPKVLKLQERLVSDLSDDEVQTFLATMNRIHANALK